MNILILEDCEVKLEKIRKIIEISVDDSQITICKCFFDFTKESSSKKYDIIVVDLVVPQFKDSNDTIDASEYILEPIRTIGCHNFCTPTIAITQHKDAAVDNFELLNSHDITILTYSHEDDSWISPLVQKLQSNIPRLTYDFVIVCALDKEAEAFSEAGYQIGPIRCLMGIKFRTINIKNKRGIIAIPVRMGLVSSAITSSRAIDIFNPKLVCMSGICAGIDGKADVYDVIIPESCHQHDSGKWTNDGFIPELYSVQIQHKLRLLIEEITSTDEFLNEISTGYVASNEELPPNINSINPKVKIATTSSGSSVIADNKMLKVVENTHKRMTAFEMESYSLYESARQALSAPMCFSAKCVVDNGNENKGDEYHRIAAIVSAKSVYKILEKLEF